MKHLYGLLSCVTYSRFRRSDWSTKRQHQQRYPCYGVARGSCEVGLGPWVIQLGCQKEEDPT